MVGLFLVSYTTSVEILNKLETGVQTQLATSTLDLATTNPVELWVASRTNQDSEHDIITTKNMTEITMI